MTDAQNYQPAVAAAIAEMKKNFTGPPEVVDLVVEMFMKGF